jgi:MFS family permease
MVNPIQHRPASAPLSATVCHAVVTAGLALFGATYLTADRPMTYHLAVLGVSWEELPSSARLLVLALLHGVGVGGLVGAAAMAVLLAVPFRRGEAWARIAVPAIGFAALVPALGIAARLAIATGARTPWPAAAGGIALLVAGLTLSGPSASSHRRCETALPEVEVPWKR